LRKIGFVEFTIPYLTNDVFKISQNGVRNKVLGWENLGIVEKVGRKIVKTSDRPVNNYTISDIRVAKYVFEKMSVLEFIKNKYRECPECSAVLWRDWEILQKRECTECGHEIKPSVNNKVKMKSKRKKRMDKPSPSDQPTLSDFSN
jgi:Zn ribbon nucleic-acid-binding protein